MKQNISCCSTTAQSKYSPWLLRKFTRQSRDAIVRRVKNGQKKLSNQRHTWADGVGDCSGANFGNVFVIPNQSN